MAPVFQKTTELDRLRKWVNEGKEYTALKELAAVAGANKLRPEAGQTITSTDNKHPLSGPEIFPNPAAETVTLRINNPVFSEIDATLFDVRGAFVRPVFKGIPGQEFFEHSISLDNLPAGYYLLKAIGPDGMFIRPVVKF